MKEKGERKKGPKNLVLGWNYLLPTILLLFTITHRPLVSLSPLFVYIYAYCNIHVSELRISTENKAITVRAIAYSPLFRSPTPCCEQLLVDVFLLPLERWAKELEAQREYDHDYSSDVDSSPDKWAPDFNLEGVSTTQSKSLARRTYIRVSACMVSACNERIAPFGAVRPVSPSLRHGQYYVGVVHASSFFLFAPPGGVYLAADV